MLEGPMENKIQVANYTATLTRELYRMCHKAGLTDLAYLLEVAAEEASKDRLITTAINGTPRRKSQAKDVRVLNGPQMDISVGI
jgi:hypothetical protein